MPRPKKHPVKSVWQDRIDTAPDTVFTPLHRHTATVYLLLPHPNKTSCLSLQQWDFKRIVLQSRTVKGGSWLKIEWVDSKRPSWVPDRLVSDTARAEAWSVQPWHVEDEKVGHKRRVKVPLLSLHSRSIRSHGKLPAAPHCCQFTPPSLSGGGISTSQVPDVTFTGNRQACIIRRYSTSGRRSV